MSDHLTDEEQVEKVKAWLKENGTSIVAGVVIGLGGIFGWQFWDSYQANKAAEGAEAYDRFVQVAQQADPGITAEEVARLDESFANSSYSQFAALELARQQAEAGELDAARTTLEKTREGIRDGAMQAVIDLRLARLLMSQGKLDEAGALIGKLDAGPFAAEAASLRGQIAWMQGKNDEARAALEEARALGASDEIVNYLLTELQEQT
ncbi:MAG: tetratricopeptide repeat protein [Sedimenticolaceae bacterium]|nr:tetratricopeptide repeat protein [Sedimenticolaceae bacterium]